MDSSQQHIHLEQPLRCIVKLGGAAITCKGEFEILNKQVLNSVTGQLREAIIGSAQTRTMDWSRQVGTMELEFSDQFQAQELSLEKYIVIHGAGSFGHFQANKVGVHNGGLPSPALTAGFVATRISVGLLNLEVVRMLARDGIPAIGMPPLALGWSTSNRNVDMSNIASIVQILNAGFIPVLHGDAVLDNVQGCTILSGDVIMRKLAQELKPQYVVFLTNVAGVFDRPPSEANAVLLKEIVVHEDGSWSIVRPLLPRMERTVHTDIATHDTTGGMAAKIEEAASIARLGIDVLIVEAGTEHSLNALKHGVSNEMPDSWVGTLVRYTT